MIGDFLYAVPEDGAHVPPEIDQITQARGDLMVEPDDLSDRIRHVIGNRPHVLQRSTIDRDRKQGLQLLE